MKRLIAHHYSVHKYPLSIFISFCWGLFSAKVSQLCFPVVIDIGKTVSILKYIEIHDCGNIYWYNGAKILELVIVTKFIDIR